MNESGAEGMKDDIRRQTCLIIRRNGEYLVGTILYSQDLRWSISRSDAWRTRDREKARRIARATGGTVMLYNPIIGRERIF